MNYYGLLQGNVFWVDREDGQLRVFDGTLADFNDRYGCIEECCSPRGVEPRWQLQELDAYVIGDFRERVRDGDVSGCSLEYLRWREGFFLSHAEAEDAACDEEGEEDGISGGTLWAVCCWNPDGSKDYPYVYGDRRDALKGLEKIWMYDIWNRNENAPTPHWTREEAEADLAMWLAEDDE